MSDEDLAEAARMSDAIDAALADAHTKGCVASLTSAIARVEALREFTQGLLGSAEQYGFNRAAVYHRAMIQAYDFAIEAIRGER